MLFNPEESVDFQGNTGSFIQYTYARIQSILRKAEFSWEIPVTELEVKELHAKEKQIIKDLEQYPGVVLEAAAQYSPALIANFTYDLVKDFNSLYQQVSILGEADIHHRNFRVQLAHMVGEVIDSAMSLLGIEVPQRM
jgi:arginyl-tRNA synthetase